jgi:hypoxanthine phosphoribosyltransferase
LTDPASLDSSGAPPSLGAEALGLLPEPAASSGPSFAHASEAEMARILDFYGVEWHYEPTTFPILWNLEGDVVESFSPDFYLPEFELYLEMTTLKQSLVRKKNRKLRRLRELYPDIRIKLFYARDFRAMLLKYGRFGLAQSLSGTSGQLVAGELLRPVPAEAPVPEMTIAEVDIAEAAVAAAAIAAQAIAPSRRRRTRLAAREGELA